MSDKPKTQCCEKPEQLKKTPRECTPEQISECHGPVEVHPCIPAGGCEQPDQLKAKPGDCSPEQIKKCHGTESTHPCV